MTFHQWKEEKYNETPLVIACNNRGSILLVKTLLENGSNVNQKGIYFKVNVFLW